MKRKMTRWGLLTFASIFTARLGLAQDVTGIWVGSMAGSPVAVTRGRGPTQRWVINVAKDRRGELTGTVADQGSAHLFTALVSISVNSLKLTFTFVLPSGPMSFVGTLSDDGNSAVVGCKISD